MEMKDFLHMMPQKLSAIPESWQYCKLVILSSNSQNCSQSTETYQIHCYRMPLTTGPDGAHMGPIWNLYTEPTYGFLLMPIKLLAGCACDHALHHFTQVLLIEGNWLWDGWNAMITFAMIGLWVLVPQLQSLVNPGWCSTRNSRPKRPCNASSSQRQQKFFCSNTFNHADSPHYATYPWILFGSCLRLDN